VNNRFEYPLEYTIHRYTHSCPDTPSTCTSRYNGVVLPVC
jgi:hypothetical protein